MKTFILGLIIGWCIVALAGYVYFAFGFAPVSVYSAPMPFEKFMANTALHAKIDREMPKSVPMQGNEATYSAGAQVYRDNCAVCHGMPAGPQTNVGQGEFPKPPKLLQGKGVTDDPPGETYWKVANGIRLTGMPGFKKTLSEDQMWQVSLLLADADKLPASVKDELASPEALPGEKAPAPVAPAPATHK